MSVLRRIFFSSGIALLVFGVLSSFNTFVTYRKLKKQYAKSLHEHERSNCVVMYACGYLSGWPPYKNRIKCGMDSINVLFEPVIYFIDLAERTLDIAVMMLTVEKYVEALVRARQRGVKIRLITQFDRNSKHLTKLMKLADNVTLFVPSEDVSPKLLHYKYMIRDFKTSNQCVCMGSMNFTITGATDNFENLVFTQTSCIVECVHDNFETAIQVINDDNKQLYKRSILLTIPKFLN